MGGDTAKPREPIELRVLESETKDLTLFSRSDLVFALLYGFLFLWGLVLTLISI